MAEVSHYRCSLNKVAKTDQTKIIRAKFQWLFILLIYCILLGRIYNCPEGKGTRGLQGPIRRCPTSLTASLTYERQPQHRDHPTLFE